MKPKEDIYIGYYGHEKVKDISKLEKGQVVRFIDKEGNLRIGSIRIKAVICGKPYCHKCPHKIYAYGRYRSGNKVREKYIGIAR